MSEITYSNDEMFRAFKNMTAEGINHAASLTLEQLPDGTFSLIGYDWCKIADISPEGNITVYSEWGEWAQARFEMESSHGGEATTHRHVRQLKAYLEESNREYTESRTLPSVGTPPKRLRQLGHFNMIPNRASETRTETGRTE